MTSSNRL